MSGRIAKSQILLLARVKLSPDASLALMKVKNDLKDPARRARLKPFFNTRGRNSLEGPPLPKLAQGCKYFEVDVGIDRLGGRGVKRLVLEVNTSSWQLLDVYYTDEHYAKSLFVRVV